MTGKTADSAVTRLSLGVLLLVEGVLLLFATLGALPAAVEANRAVASVNVRPCAGPAPAPSPTPSPSGTAAPATAGAPAATPAPGARDVPVRTPVLGGCLTVSSDAALFLLVIVVGALGATVQAATAFGNHLGRERFKPSYNWWYVLRPLIGAGLAAVFYLVLRGGLLAIAGDDDAPNVYGIAAIGALAGLFSFPAMRRLQDVFDRTTGGDDSDSGKPVITKVEPASLPVGAADRQITITGTGFGSDPGVDVERRRRTVSGGSATSATVTLDAADVAKAGTLRLRVIANNRWSDDFRLPVS